MNVNYLEKEIFSKNLFLKEECLEINFIPDHLLHREQELIMLSKIFVKLIEKPFSISRKITIQGEVGIGKTVIAKTFGKMLLMSADKRGLNISYVHINCRKEKTPYNILNRILSNLNCNIPKRGYSPQELTHYLEDYLKKTRKYLVLTLDELNYLQKSHFNLIYSLSRCNESSFDNENYLSLIIIVRNLALLGNLDDSTKSTLQGNILSLKKYTQSQIVDILTDRVKISIRAEVFSPELIHFIASNIEGLGDIRKGLNIIRNATKIAESQEREKVTKDIIEMSLQNTIPNLQVDVLDTFNQHQNMVLFTIIQFVINNCEQEITFSDIENTYLEMCKKKGEVPRKHTQIWTYIQQFEHFGFISVKTVSKNIKGRKSFISVSDLPLNSMYNKLNKKIRDFNYQM